MAMNLLDGIGWVQQQGEMGRQQGVRSRVAELASQTYTATPDQRPSLLGQMAALSPESAAATEQQFVQRDEQAASAEDRRNKFMVQNARLLAAAPEQHKAGLYQRLRPELERLGLSNLPQTYDQTVAEAVSALSQAYGGAQQANVQRTFIGEDGQMWAVMRDGTTQPLGVNADRRTQFVDVPDVGPQLIDLRKGTASTVTSAGGQAPVRQFDVQPSGAPMPTDPLEIEAARRAMTDGGTYHVANGRVVPGQSGGGQPPAPAAPTGAAGAAWVRPASQGAEESFGQPQAVTDPTTGQVKMVQFSNRGGQREVPGYAPPPTARDAKPPTEGERGAAGYMGRMAEAEQLLTQIEAGGYEPGGLRDHLTAGQGALLNWAATPDGQRYRQAQEDWVRAKLRKESGAVIGDEEMAREIKVYFPQPGDGPAVLDQKRASRAQAMEQMRSMAGRAAPEQQAAPPAAAPSGQYQPGQVIEVNGRRFRVIGGDPNDPDVEEI